MKKTVNTYIITGSARRGSCMIYSLPNSIIHLSIRIGDEGLTQIERATVIGVDIT